MKSNVTTQEIRELFYECEEISDEYLFVDMPLIKFGIDLRVVLDWLKSIGEYDDTFYVEGLYGDDFDENIDVDAKVYSFQDVAVNFMPENYDRSDEEISYDIAAQFITSSFCTEAQFKSFIKEVTDYEGKLASNTDPECADWYQEQLDNFNNNGWIQNILKRALA